MSSSLEKSILSMPLLNGSETKCRDATRYRRLARTPWQSTDEELMEIFNLLNHPNFQLPGLPNDIFDSTGPNPAVGLLTSTTTSSRQIQLGFKLIW